MKIELLESWHGQTRGEIIDVSAGVADLLIGRDVARTVGGARPDGGEKRLASPPQDKRLSGPPENK